MPNPDYNFRVRADRSIYILGDFSENLLKEAIPRITELRAEEGNLPISLVITSHGGEVACLNAIICALAAPDGDGKQPRVISCVNGYADSCAAILLTCADYAIASGDSTIHFHGVRTEHYEITTERAAQLADRLSKDNKATADYMARAMMPRVMHRFSRIKKEIAALKRKKRKPLYPSVMAFTDVITTQLSPTAEKIFFRAINRLVRMRRLSVIFSKLKFKRTDTALQKDAQLLEKVIEYEINDPNRGDLRLNESGVSQVMLDYLTLREFHFGEHIHFLDDMVKLWGPEFLNEKESREYNRLEAKSKAKAHKFLTSRVNFCVQDFWYLTISLARTLFSGENNLSSWDAYWIGALDEIIGEDRCFGLRQMLEQEVATPATSPNA